MGPLIDEFASWSPASLWPGHAPYSFSDLETFWERAGGSATIAPIAAAIAMAEQGANQLGDWVNGQPQSLGPWQVNAANWPALEAAGIIKSPADLMDPIKNAMAAIFISGNGANFNPWTTYWSTDGGKTNSGPGNGAFRQYLPGGITIPSSASTGSGSANFGGSGSSASSRSPVNFTPGTLAAIAAIGAIIAILGIVL